MKRKEGEFLWERNFERSWEGIEEDESGLLRVDGEGGVSKGSGGGVAPGVRPLAPLQRGLLRCLMVVLDCSASSELTDMRPSRAEVMEERVGGFIAAFFDANPLSSLALVKCVRGQAELVSGVSGSPSGHGRALKAAMRRCVCPTAGESPCQCGRRREGDFSLENALRLCLDTLSLQPEVATREVVVLMSSLSTVDPGDVHALARQCASQRVRVSTLALPGEVYVATQVARVTGGRFGVPTSEWHLGELLASHCQPPPRTPAEVAVAKRAGMLMPAGFPELLHQKESMCACHLQLHSTTFVCPRCASHCCNVPTECPVCYLRLVDASAVASSYHHIFPVPPFLQGQRGGRGREGEGEGGEVDEDLEGGMDSGKQAEPPALCTGCSKALGTPGAQGAPHFFSCAACTLPFCSACNTTIHDTLFSCPGCPEYAASLVK
jgi:transcription initiation factor TFIIH subunit 2